MLRDLGFKAIGEVWGDASAALGIIHRKGFGGNQTYRYQPTMDTRDGGHSKNQILQSLRQRQPRIHPNKRPFVQHSVYSCKRWCCPLTNGLFTCVIVCFCLHLAPSTLPADLLFGFPPLVRFTFPFGIVPIVCSFGVIIHASRAHPFINACFASGNSPKQNCIVRLHLRN